MKGAVTGIILLVILIYSVFITQNIAGLTTRTDFGQYEGGTV